MILYMRKITLHIFLANDWLGMADRFHLFTIMVCAGVDLPPGQRESALMEGGAADV